MLIAANTAAAQSVRGTARETGTGLPISGAVVWLGDSAGALLARSIADVDGRFSVVRLAASARLHVLHIGFRPVDLAIDPGAPDPVINVQMSPVPLALAAIEASSRRVCPGDKGTSDALDLWEQARSALLAGVVARETAPPKMRIMSFTRSYDPIAHTLLSQSVRARDMIGDHSYVAGRSAWAFAEEGYMREEVGGARTYYAPDDNVMLDPAFAGTHCMRVVQGDGAKKNDIGLSFEPVRDQRRDTLVDLAGVLWIDRGTNVLRSVEFHYVGLEPAGRASGGEIFFSTMPNGAPMIDHWMLRFAVIVDDIPLHPGLLRRRKLDRSQRTDVSVTEFRESGGAVAVAEWPDGTDWRSPYLSAVRGQLLHLNGSPAAGVRVWLQNTPDTTTTSVDGYFTIQNVLPGRYSLRGADSVLARVGITRVWGEARVGPDAPKGRPLWFYYSRGEVLKLACRGQSVPPGTGIVLGRVVNSTGDAVPDAQVTAHWNVPQGDSSSAPTSARTTEADADGRFAFCGAP
ncbi:MAG: carboxypeptidase-like regulatory domain-containing protein, partial [Gemmatimonadaceae bacterium]